MDQKRAERVRLRRRRLGGGFSFRLCGILDQFQNRNYKRSDLLTSRD